MNNTEQPFSLGYFNFGNGIFSVIRMGGAEITVTQIALDPISFNSLVLEEYVMLYLKHHVCNNS